MTAVSAICLLGLAIWFSKTEPLAVPATFCYRLLLCCTPFNLGGCILYFEALFLSSGRCRFVFSASPRFESTSRRGALFLLFRGGAEPTSFPLPCQPASSTLFFPPSRFVASATSLLRGRRLLPPPRWESTSLVDFVFHLSVSPESSRRQCDFAFPFEGARLLPLRRVRSQPPLSTLSSH